MTPEEAIERFGEVVKTGNGGKIHVDATCRHIRQTRIIIDDKSQIPLRADVCSACDPSTERKKYSPDDLCVPAIEDAEEVSD
jgi:hypothetical protein